MVKECITREALVIDFASRNHVPSGNIDDSINTSLTDFFSRFETTRKYEIDISSKQVDVILYPTWFDR